MLGFPVGLTQLALGLLRLGVRQLRHLRMRPYTPKTNGNAERSVQTRLRERAYAKPYLSSAQREAALQPFLHRYNWHRPQDRQRP